MLASERVSGVSVLGDLPLDLSGAFAPLLSIGKVSLAVLGSGMTAFAASLILPLVVAILVGIVGRNETDSPQAGNSQNVRDWITTVGSLLTFLSVCGVYAAWAAGEVIAWTPIELFPGVGLSFTVEPLGLIFALVASCLWVPTSIYAFGYMRGHHETNQTRFFVCFALAIFAAIAIAFAGNLATLFVFYEVLTFSTFPLVAHHQNEEAKQSGRVYLGILVGTSVCFFLMAIIWTWSLTGTVDFVAGGVLEGSSSTTGGPVSPGITLALLLLFAFGIGKAALMPFHRWLPAAMVAPTPVSALLHAVAVVKAGVFAVVKVVAYVLGVDHLRESLGSYFVWNIPANQILVSVACFTILSASVVALRQDNLKRRLAYSTIGQLSYIVLGAALLNDMGVTAGALHIMSHAVGKITLFFCAGAIFVAAHKKNVSEMGGLGRRMPWTYGAFLVGSMSIIGLPPFVGTWSKWSLLLAAFESGRWWVAAVVVVSSLLAIGYLMPVIVDGFFGGRESKKKSRSHDTREHHETGHQAREEGGEAPILCVAPLVFTAALCLFFFVAVDEWYALARAVTSVMGGSVSG